MIVNWFGDFIVASTPGIVWDSLDDASLHYQGVQGWSANNQVKYMSGKGDKFANELGY